MCEEDILNLAIAEELIKEINPSVTQERVQEIWSVCMGNPWNAGILYQLLESNSSTSNDE